MTPIVAIGLGLAMLAQGGFVDAGGNLRPTPGPLGRAASAAPAPTYTPYAPPTYDAPPARRTSPAYTLPRFPSPPEPPEPPTLPEPAPFKPYKGTSVYSNRGGLDAHPAPAKPRGYIDLR